MKNDSLIIITASLEHSEDIWIWRNDPVTRTMFRSSDLVTWDEHSSWFENSIDNPSRFIYIALLNDRPVGVVRFDAISFVEGKFETSINVAPTARRAGIGRNLLAGAINALKEDTLCVKEIVAEVKSTNPASNALFHSVGFLRTAPVEEGYNYYIFTES